MSEAIIKYIKAPLSAETVKELRAGDVVRISGYIYTARDAAHKRLTEALARGEELPLDLKDNVIYYVGPSPTKPGEVVGSAGPTTSGRMDKYTPTMIQQGMRGMIGKGLRSQEVIDACKEYGAVYFAAVGGAAAVIAQSIKGEEMIAYEDLVLKQSVVTKQKTSLQSQLSMRKVTTSTKWVLQNIAKSNKVYKKAEQNVTVPLFL